MQRYFAKEKCNDQFILYDSDLHHIKNVMRAKIDDQIEVVYDNIVYLCEIKNISPLELKIVGTLDEHKDLGITLTVAISLVQEQKFDLIIQKLTELGVTNIIPIKTERSIVKLDNQKIEKKLSRWQMICKEASEQSKRTSIPQITDVISLKELKDNKSELKLICSLSEHPKYLNEYLNNNIKSILFAIGPEGGFSPNEEEYLLNNGFKPVSLGARVMRVETAAIYVTSIINYIYERWL